MQARKSVCLLSSLFLLFLQLAPTTSAHAQESDARQLINHVMNRHLAASYVHELDRTAAWIAYIEGVAIMAEHEDWPTEKDNLMGDLRSFSYDVHNLEIRLVSTLVDLKRDAQRNKVFALDEQARFDAILQDVYSMIDGSQEMYNLLKAGRIDEAGDFYRTQTRTLFRKVQGDTFTMVNSIENDLQKARLKIRTLE